MKDFEVPRSRKKSVLKSGHFFITSLNSHFLVGIKMLNNDQL